VGGYLDAVDAGTPQAWLLGWTGDYNAAWDVFRWDRVTGTTSLVSRAGDGVQGDNYSEQPSLSADGRTVAFMSYASNFVPGTSPYSSNVYVRELAQ